MHDVKAPVNLHMFVDMYIISWFDSLIASSLVPMMNICEVSDVWQQPQSICRRFRQSTVSPKGVQALALAAAEQDKNICQSVRHET